jgi:hypothetical protein
MRFALRITTALALLALAAPALPCEGQQQKTTTAAKDAPKPAAVASAKAEKKAPAKAKTAQKAAATAPSAAN